MSTVNPGQFVNNLGQSYGPDSVFPPVYLTGATLTANAAAFPTLAFAVFPSLELRIRLLGFTGSDLPSLRFNGDTGNNYNDRNISIAAGGVVNVDNATTTTSQIRMGIAGTKQLIADVSITNFLSVSKLVHMRVSMASGAVGTAPTIISGSSGEWVNTTAQITSLTVQCVGANSILAGSSLMIFGGF